MHVVILSTEAGKGFARRIGQCLHTLGHNYLITRPRGLNGVIERHGLTPENCIIHSRTANPQAAWFRNLLELTETGFYFTNRVSTLENTSDKLFCNILLINRIPGESVILETIPFTKWYAQRDCLGPEVCLKLRYSVGNGQHVHFVRSDDNNLLELANSMPGQVIVQPRIYPTKIFRFFCFAEQALNVTTYDDTPDEQGKLSVCLNRNQKFTYIDDNNEDKLAGQVAVNAQHIVAGDINFVDVFMTPTGPVLSEINTACNLTIHETVTGTSFSGLIARFLGDIADERS